MILVVLCSIGVVVLFLGGGGIFIYFFIAG